MLIGPTNQIRKLFQSGNVPINLVKNSVVNTSTRVDELFWFYINSKLMIINKT